MLNIAVVPLVPYKLPSGPSRRNFSPVSTFSHEQRHRIALDREPGLPPAERIRGKGAHLEHGTVPHALGGIGSAAGAVLGARGGGTGLAKDMEPRTRVAGAFRQMVRWRQAECLRELPRPASRHGAAKQGGHHLGRRAGREAHADLPAIASGSLPLCQCAEATRRAEGRPRSHLPADDSGGGDRHARLRAHRRGAFGGLRRLFARRASRTGWAIARRRSSSRRMAAIGAAASCR